jgi:CheY-like chemotaxis protein
MINDADRLVLVVEDSDEDFETILEAARRSNMQHPIRRAINGDECLDALQGADSKPLNPSILLLDLNTPGIDGRETLATIRADPNQRALPIVVLSTSWNPKDVEHCYAHGANAYHVKPLRYSDHLALMNEIFAYWLKHAVLPSTDEETR